MDCPIMSTSASIAVHIDLLRAYGASADTYYLHASPEYGMKKLLSEGIGDIYQISHVFRDSVRGMQQNPEETLVQWYRTQMSFTEMIEESIDFIKEFVGPLPVVKMNYREALKKYAGIDYLKISEKELLQYLEKKGIDPYQDIEEEGIDVLLNIVLGVIVQPQLGKKGICVLQYYPASQAFLAQTRLKGKEKVAERFTLYYQGMELGSGYHALDNHEEQIERLIVANQIRARLGKDTLPVDESFINALEKGIPDCCSVSVNFDKLMMIRHQKEDIADVIALLEK